MKAVGDFDFSRQTNVDGNPLTNRQLQPDEMRKFQKHSLAQVSFDNTKYSIPEVDILSYKPNVQCRDWIISETDLSWISIGCYILGTGGGGSPYGHMLRLREIMRNGGIVHVISPDDLRDEDLVACGGGKGSPTVSIEKLPGDEYVLKNLRFSAANFSME